MGGARLWTELLFGRRLPRDRVLCGAVSAAATAAVTAAVSVSVSISAAAFAATAAGLAAVAPVAISSGVR